MTLNISQALDKVSDFYVLKVDKIANELIAKGKDIIKLNLGKSELEMHETVINTFKEKISDSTISNIVDSQGLLQLREEIVSYYKKLYNVDFSINQVFINNGTSPLFLALFSVLVDANDTVLLPRPYYPSYSAMAEMVHANKEFYNIVGGEIDIEDFKNKFDPEKTKIVVLNSPGNPLGNIISKDKLKQILDIVDGKSFILSDEIYDKFSYGDFTSILQVFNPHRDKIIFLNGFSKIHHMYTRRLGYAVVPETVIPALLRFQQHTLVCVDPVPQYAAITSLKNMDNLMKEEIKKEIGEYKERLNDCEKIISGTKLGLIKPKGSWYFCINIRNYLNHNIKNSLDFAENLIKNADVAVAPGIDFGDDEICRVSLTSSRIVEGVEKMCKFLNTL